MCDQMMFLVRTHKRFTSYGRIDCARADARGVSKTAKSADPYDAPPMGVIAHAKEEETHGVLPIFFAKLS